ncbi:MAG: hypothetical protein KDD41_00280 [Flavobacteriales bacterium]|nr:hypothetical protein [Flavobacteriales bacterium]
MKALSWGFVLACVTILFSCNTDELEGEIANLQEQNLEAQGQLNEKEELIVEFIGSMNEIQDNLAKIKEREGIMTARFDKGNVEMDNGMKEDIIADIEMINNLLLENKEKMSSLNARLKKSNLRISELEKMIQNLEMQLQEKDAQIANLQSQLAEANQQLAVLFEEYNNRIEELGEQEEKLNKAFYCYGSEKELKAQGVITKEGGFIGLGKTAKLSEDFNKEYFTQVNISVDREIELNVKKVKMITNHPKESYDLVGTEGNYEKIVIKDPETFWSSSKYLVLVVE